MINLKSESLKTYLEAVLNKKFENLTEKDIKYMDKICISGLDESNNPLYLDFEDLNYFSSLNSLVVLNAPLSVESIQQISNKRDIKAIDFEKCEFENEDSLKSLNHLESLKLLYCRTKSYSFLKSYFRLKRFMVIDPKDETTLDVTALGGNFNMRELMLQRCILANEGAIVNLPNIEVLSILWSSFGDGSVESLKHLKNLKILYTSSPLITATMEYKPGLEVRNNLNELVVERDEDYIPPKII